MNDLLSDLVYVLIRYYNQLTSVIELSVLRISVSINELYRTIKLGVLKFILLLQDFFPIFVLKRYFVLSQRVVLSDLLA